MPQNLVAVYSRFMLEKRNKRQLRDAFFALYDFFFFKIISLLSPHKIAV